MRISLPRFDAVPVHPIVHDTPLGGKEVLNPHLFNVNQGALPFIEKKMLQCG